MNTRVEFCRVGGGGKESAFLDNHGLIRGGTSNSRFNDSVRAVRGSYIHTILMIAAELRINISYSAADGRDTFFCECRRWEDTGEVGSACEHEYPGALCLIIPIPRLPHLYTVKKKLRDSWICFDQTFLGLVKLFPAWESLVSDIPAGDGNTAKPFLQCTADAHSSKCGPLSH